MWPQNQSNSGHMETQALQISIRELKAKPAFAIARARAGVTVQITSHRKTVAQLVAADSSSDAAAKAAAKRKSAPDSGSSNSPVTTREVLERLRSAGVQVTEASNSLSLGKPVTFAPSPDGKTMSELVLDMRGLR
jgi:antitoxin (DNA-binding transcriptional repressor) of toxin-antitoxin stability system